MDNGAVATATAATTFAPVGATVFDTPVASASATPAAAPVALSPLFYGVPLAKESTFPYPGDEPGLDSLLRQGEPPDGGFEVGSLEWILAETQVQPPGAATVRPVESIVQQEELDRLVQQKLVDCLSERVNLQKRVDVVHKAGKIDDEERCNMMVRAVWAVPFFVVMEGVRKATQSISACCAAGPRRACDVEQIPVGKEPIGVEPQPPAAVLAAQNATQAVPGAVPSAAPVMITQPRMDTQQAAQMTTQPQMDTQPTRMDTQPTAAVAPTLDAQQTVGSQQPQLDTQQSQPAASSSKSRSKPKGDKGSVLSMQLGSTSSAAALLGGVKNKPAGSAGSSADPAAQRATGASSSASPSAVANRAPPGENTDAPTAQEKKRERKPGESRTVVAGNFQGSSAAGNLLGAAMKQPKAKRPNDAKSSIG